MRIGTRIKKETNSEDIHQHATHAPADAKIKKEKGEPAKIGCGDCTDFGRPPLLLCQKRDMFVGAISCFSHLFETATSSTSPEAVETFTVSPSNDLDS